MSNLNHYLSRSCLCGLMLAASLNSYSHVTANANNTSVNPAVPQLGNLQGNGLDIVHQSVKKITGVVKDAAGVPIIGANVRVKGSTNGTITDIDGNFSLDIAENTELLEVSYIGYKSQVLQIKGKKELVVVLKEDTEVLDEVVVVGFGTQKKVNLTGAVSTVSSEAFEDRPVQNVAMMLQGVMPGLNISMSDGQMDSAPNINIRGTSTIGEVSKGI